ALRESEEKYRNLVENAHDGIAIVQDQRLRYVNPQLARMLGRSVDEMLATPVSAYIDQETLDRVLREFTSLVEQDDTVMDWEGPFVNGRGKNVEAKARISPIMYGGRPAALLFLYDLTERKRAERIIADQQLKMTTSAKMSELGVMATGIAHEIKNPLAVLSAAAEQLHDLCAQPAPDKAAAEKLIAAMLRNVTRMGSIVKSLENFSRDSANASFEETSIKTVVDDILELCRARFRAYHVALTVSDTPPELQLACQATQLGQVLLNLLNNALDAAAGMPERWVRLDIAEFGETIEFAVTDSGGGLPPDLSEKIFRPFFTTKPAGKGIGLGLVISKEIVETHGGLLFIDASCPNTRFVVRLPKQRQAKTADVRKDALPYGTGFDLWDASQTPNEPDAAF
ncbi:MAG: hypothetical protein QG656_222, partial [Candidatus Hydrogenedentes bacterium]|nr:hypothetical protein [Candidatus Hydrogenedentota bacterium]